MSAPSTLTVDQDALSMERMIKKNTGVKLDQQTIDFQILYLSLSPPQGSFVLRNMGSFKSTNPGSPIIPCSGPLPLPPSAGGGLRNYSFFRKYQLLVNSFQLISVCQKVYRPLFTRQVLVMIPRAPRSSKPQLLVCFHRLRL